MPLNMSQRGVLGVVLMVVGTLAFMPGALPSSGSLMSTLVLPAALLLTLGTYLVGTDLDGRPA